MCMYVCMYMCMCMCMCVYMYTSMYMNMYMNIYHIYTPFFAYLSICMCTCICKSPVWLIEGVYLKPEKYCCVDPNTYILVITH